ncbi:IS110 family transposase [Sphingobium sp. AP50]|uniref:IS110 family transposase n=1 Tax=Sphingobium sp. AP50 TaxID=1884369 RepID=UPI00210BD4EC|nr:IS110 family transposase [Sphingobium sp. AP50]
MAASRRYQRPCVAMLAAACIDVAVVNPRQIRRFAGALDRLAKTDSIDAALITHVPDREPSVAVILQLSLRPASTQAS